MARVRSPARDKAKEIYLAANGDIRLVDIAAELNIKDTQVRKWKSQDKWDNENTEINIRKIRNEKTIKRINMVRKDKNNKNNIYFDMVNSIREIINDKNASNTEKIAACNTMIKIVNTPGLSKRLNSLTRKMDFSKTNSISEKDWNKSIDYFRNSSGEQSCAYCGKHYKKLEKEHIKPLSNGGKAVIGNIIPSCRICNTTKNNKEFVEWYLGSRVYSEERMNKIFDYIEKWGDSNE